MYILFSTYQNLTPKAKQQNNKNKQMGAPQTNLPHSKRNHQLNKKAANRMGETIFK